MHDSFAVHLGHCLAERRLMKATVETTFDKTSSRTSKGQKKHFRCPTTLNLPSATSIQRPPKSLAQHTQLSLPGSAQCIPDHPSHIFRHCQGQSSRGRHVAQLGSALYRPRDSRDTRRSKSWPPGSQKTSRSGNGKFCIAAALHEQGSRISRLL